MYSDKLNTLFNSYDIKWALYFNYPAKVYSIFWLRVGPGSMFRHRAWIQYPSICGLLFLKVPQSISNASNTVKSRKTA
jgi:hypothetical protein